MKPNPFEKSKFKCHRDWEASLIKFLAREARTPDIRNWLELSTAEPNVKTAAAFSALLLSDLLETWPAFRETVDAAYKFYKVLKMTENETEDFEQWLRSGWLKLARVADLLEFELTHS